MTKYWDNLKVLTDNWALTICLQVAGIRESLQKTENELDISFYLKPSNALSAQSGFRLEGRGAPAACSISKRKKLI